MTRPDDIIPELAKLQTVATAGFALAFHIEYTRPTFLFQTYPEVWISEYSEKGLVMSDPTVHWGFENEGTKRWSDLESEDSAGVLKMAAAHGLNYGLAIALEEDGTRSMGSFACIESEFSDAESDELSRRTTLIHKATAGLKVLPATLLSQLEEMGIRISQPGGQ